MRQNFIQFMTATVHALC